MQILEPLLFLNECSCLLIVETIDSWVELTNYIGAPKYFCQCVWLMVGCGLGYVKLCMHFAIDKSVKPHIEQLQPLQLCITIKLFTNIL